MAMVSWTLGSPTNTGWNRRSRAASFSMCLRYSSRVVAPTMRSSPRASIGFSVLPGALARCGRPDEAQPAAGQHRLEHVAGVHGPLGGAGPDDGVELVDEGDDLAVGLADVVEHGLEPLLELAPELAHGAHV